ncbi:IclR family transcriptional regulator [Cryobacterium sp. Hh7]|uniref:IclR family transcriptional regulator n=1 Tax=Cryobacterium sp. Hh7 TaxID=1259159 RepID=UPI00141B6D9B|nr:IclR family transcriptional regulator [Cryobacterium sp. Hh7]
MTPNTDQPHAAPERKGPEGLGAVDRAGHILFTLAAHPQGIGLAELSRETGITMTTAHRLLATLRKRNLVRETPDGLQALGAATLVLSGAFLDGLDVRSEARPFLVSLRDETNETCHLGVLASPQIVYIDKIDSTRRVRMVSQVGGTGPAFSTAIGKSFLAYASTEVLDNVLRETNSRRVEAVNAVALQATLTQDRSRGFSTDLEENEPGICCVGAPIMDSSGRVVAGMSVSTPRERFDLAGLDRLGANVRAKADEISRTLGYRKPE